MTKKTVVRIIGISVLALVVLAIAGITVFLKYETAAGELAREKAAYVALLREANYAPDTVTLKSEYCMDDENLAKVRTHFRLDTLFDGTEDTYRKGLKIQRFVSDHLPHGNPPEMPPGRNAIDLWAFADTSGYHLNCRLHSILMRDMLLAVGIKARYITCLPYDEQDQDCHVVNEMFSPELGKWIMLDSDQDKVVTDMSGIPLSLREWRDKLIADEPYLIDGKINKGQDYDAYMAKNSYWYSRHEMSCMDDETGETLPGDRYVSLIPVGYTVRSGGTQWLFENSVHTTEPDEFWK